MKVLMFDARGWGKLLLDLAVLASFVVAGTSALPSGDGGLRTAPKSECLDRDAAAAAAAVAAASTRNATAVGNMLSYAMSTKCLDISDTTAPTVAAAIAAASNRNATAVGHVLSYAISTKSMAPMSTKSMAPLMHRRFQGDATGPAVATAADVTTVENVPSYVESTTTTNQADDRKPAQHSAFQVGDAVEVYDPTILRSTAFRARIVGIDDSSDDGVQRFEVRAGPDDGETHNGVPIVNLSSLGLFPAASLKAYEDYGFNARALCDLGGTSLLSNSKLVPCAVLSRSGPITYRVLGYEKARGNGMGEGGLVYREMPAWRVRRYVADGLEPRMGIEGFGPDVAFPKPLQDVASGGGGWRGVAELYGPGSKFAHPVVILGYNNTSRMYRVHHFLANAELANVKPEFIHPYKVYDKSMKLHCAIGEGSDINWTPCKLRSHFLDEEHGGAVSYRVMYQAVKTDQTLHMTLSFARVHRMLN